MTRPVPLAGYSRAIVETAEGYLGSREIGNNGGPLVTRLLRYVGIHQPAPWCTAAAVNILHEAAAKIGGRSTCPRAASGAKLWRWARKHPGECTLITDDRDLRAGDVVIMGSTPIKASRIFRGRLASGHTWIAGSKAYGGRGDHVSWEGNTNPRGSREGQGFYALTRPFNTPRVVGAIRFQALYLPGAAK